jgi:hypothetical protein
MSINNLDEVALGVNEAKIAVYAIMRKYFPKIEQSRSSLVNAFVSGVSYIYAMFQTFVRLIQNELYVSQATELESLYKLIPFVGITLYQPTTLKTDCVATIQNDAMTIDSDPELYLTGTDPFTDTDGNKFYIRTQTYLNKKVFEFDYTYTQFRGRTGGGLVLELSLSKELDELIPISFYNIDDLVVEAPYWLATSSASVKLRVRFNRTGINTDAGSDNPAQVDLPNCYCDYRTGHILLKLLTGTFNSDNLDTLPVNATYTVRSVFRKDIDRAAALVTTAEGSEAYNKLNIYGYATLAGQPASGSVIDLPLGTALQHLSINAGEGIKVDTLKVQHTVTSAMLFDFSTAVQLDDVFWGTVYKATCSYLGINYYAYLLDEWLGIVIFQAIDKIVGGGSAVSTLWTFEYTSKFNSKVLLDQHEEKLKVFTPPTELDFDSYSYVLEDTDPILFDDFSIQINDTGFTGATFTQVDSLSTVQGSTSATYFEVVLLSPTKVQVKFESVIPWDTLDSVSISYQTVKQLTSYVAGSIASGASTLEDVATVPHNVSGITSFNFDAVNSTSQAGLAGIPTIESLRSALEKAAYTLTNIINQVNYEAALQAYFVSQGWDALIKVFKYEDFGTLFINWTKGNLIYFVGLVNKYANANYVLTVPSELPSLYTGTSHEGEYTRSELALAFEETLTDVSLTYVNAVDDVMTDTLNSALRGDMVLSNYLLSASDFILMYAVYFKVKIRPKNGYTFTQASAEVKSALATLFSWQDIQFVRDINVSDVYNVCDNLTSVDKLLFTNFSHYHNDSPLIKVHDIEYKSIYQAIASTIKLSAIAATMSTPPMFSLRNVTSTNSSKYSCATQTITASSGTPFSIFTNTDTVNISGFAAVGNNKANVRVASIGGGGASITFNSADITFSVESLVVGVLVRDATSLTALGMVAGRRISITGFSTAANNVVNANIVSATSLDLVMDDLEVDLVNETYKSVSVDDDQERFENPLWDFSTVSTNARIKVDILALGGVATEEYA